MGRAPCCDKANVKKGPWSPEEDAKLKDFIEKFGTGGNWIALPQKAGLKRCGKSCRLRWLNYLRPNIKHGEFSEEEDRAICTLYASIGSRWSIIAAQLPGRTDNDIKNYWNTKLKKKLLGKFSPLPSFSSSSGLTQLQSSLNSSQIPISTLSQLYNSFYSKSLAAINDQSFLYGHNNNDDQLPLFSTNQNYNPYNYNQQNQDQGLFDFHQYTYNNYNNNNNPVKESNMLVFGGNHHDQVSCSSTSDGSYCSKDHHHHHAVKQEEIGGFQGLITNGFQENQKFMLHYGKNLDGDQMNLVIDEKTNGLVENIQLQYDLEEVKQLISSSNNFLFSNDENKTHEKSGMCYY